jgi:hypothetical protein
VITKSQSGLSSAVGELQTLVERVSQRMERIELILTIREPATSAAADAYDGLRKQVVTAVTERFAHLSQLAQIDAALSHGAEPDVLARMVDSWLEQASLLRVDDPRHPRAGALFEIVEDLGGPLRVIEPAYCDSVTGRIIRQGRARHEAPPRPVEAAAGRRAAGSRAADSAGAGPRAADSRATDPAGAGPRAADPRAVSPRATEPQAADPRADHAADHPATAGYAVADQEG